MNEDYCPCCKARSLILTYPYTVVYCMDCNFQVESDRWYPEEEFVQTGNGTVAQRLRELEEEE